MKVKELIKLLSECDKNAEVRIMSQPSYPFEYGVAGLTIRDNFDSSDSEANRNDVFLLEGEQLRYGSKRAWD